MRLCQKIQPVFGGVAVKNLTSFCAAVLAIVAVPGSVVAQGVPRAASPASALDLTKPQFDTETPHYEISASAEKAGSTIVADVSGHGITLDDMGDAVRTLPPNVQALPFDSIYGPVLQQLINVQALVVRAQRLGLDKDPAVMRRVKAATDRALSNELLLRDAGSDVTEKMMLERYDQQYAGKPGPEEAHVEVILIPSEPEAAAIIAEVAAGADFEAIARRSSRDPTAPRGGDLGFLNRESLTPEVGAVAFSLSAGQVAAHPIKSPSGWFVVRVTERRLGATPNYASVKDRIRDSLIRERFAAVAQAARNEAEVRMFDIAGKAIDATPEKGK